jgi:hypothetical protein
MNTLSRLAAVSMVAALSVPLSAEAAFMRVSAEGVFSAAAPVSDFSAPGASWSLSFVVDENPAPLPAFTESGFFTTVPFTEFQFLLNGLAAPAALFTAFYNAGNSGGLDVVFSDYNDPAALFDGLSFYGPQMYSGDEFSPTVLPGTYSLSGGGGGTGFDLVVDGVLYAQTAVNVVITRVPLPGTAALVLLALAGLGLGRARRPAGVAALR